jgi:hypothetical protein
MKYKTCKLILETNFFSYLDGDIRRYCYIMLDFATAASQNGVAITPLMCCIPVMILFHYEKDLKDIKIFYF